MMPLFQIPPHALRLTVCALGYVLRFFGEIGRGSPTRLPAGRQGHGHEFSPVLYALCPLRIYEVRDTNHGHGHVFLISG